MIDSNQDFKSTIHVFDFSTLKVDPKARETYAVKRIKALRTKQGKKRKTLTCKIGFYYISPQLFKQLKLNHNNFKQATFFIDDTEEPAKRNYFAVREFKYYNITNYYNEKEIAQNILADYDKWLKAKTKRLKLAVKNKDFSYLIDGYENINLGDNFAHFSANMINSDELVNFIANNFMACALDIERNKKGNPEYLQKRLATLINSSYGWDYFFKLLLSQSNLNEILHMPAVITLLLYLIQKANVSCLAKNSTNKTFLLKILSAIKDLITNNLPPFKIASDTNIEKYYNNTNILFRIEDILGINTINHPFAMILTDLKLYQLMKINYDVELFEINYNKTFQLQGKSDLNLLLKIVDGFDISYFDANFMSYIKGLKLDFNGYKKLINAYYSANLQNKKLSTSEKKAKIVLNNLINY